MKRQGSFQSAAPVWAALSVVVLWLAALLAAGYEDGMTIFDLMGRFSTMLERPFAVRWTPHTLKFMLTALVMYAMGIGLYYSNRQNRRPGEEYGSAKWGDPRELCRKYQDKHNPEMNIILTEHVRMSLNGYQHRRNLNIIIDGTSGTGKSQNFCIPALLSANCSVIVTDPKGELLRSTGHYLKEKGYEITVFNLVHPEQSDRYNPFHYMRKENDVLTGIINLQSSTTPKKATAGDPFWEKSEIPLCAACIFLLRDFGLPEEQNFDTLEYMLRCAEVREEDDQFQSPLDMLFNAIEEEYPNHICVSFYKVFKMGAGKTAKSILISAAVRLASFIFPQYAKLTEDDDMDFGSLGERKRAIFCVIPVDDDSMNYLVSMLYMQCFQELYRIADDKYNGRLPVPVRVLQDEWANIALPETYPKILATCRSYNIGINIFVQNIQNIKSRFEKDWESIVGNCDTLLFLGAGNEPSTLEYISKLLGKETLDTRTRGQTKGRNGSSSTNYQQAGRELMTPDEIRMLNNDNAILLIRGERPVVDQKYDVTKHPGFKKTLRGGAPPYVHHPTPDYSLPDLPYQFTSLDDIEIIELEESEHEHKEEQQGQQGQQQGD